MVIRFDCKLICLKRNKTTPIVCPIHVSTFLRPQVVYEGTNYLHHAWLNVTIWRHRWYAKKFRFGLKCVDGKFVFIRQALQLTDGLGLVTVATLLLLSNLARNGCKKLPKEFKLHALGHICICSIDNCTQRRRFKIPSNGNLFISWNTKCFNIEQKQKIRSHLNI